MSAKKTSTPVATNSDSPHISEKLSDHGADVAQEAVEKSSLLSSKKTARKKSPTPRNKKTATDANAILSMTDEKEAKPVKDAAKAAPETRKKRKTTKTVSSETSSGKKATTKRKKAATTIHIDPDAPADQPIEIPGFTDDYEVSLEGSTVTSVEKQGNVKSKATSRNRTAKKSSVRKKPQENLSSPIVFSSEDTDNSSGKSNKPAKKRSSKKSPDNKKSSTPSSVSSETNHQTVTQDNVSAVEGSAPPSDAKGGESAPHFDNLGLSQPILRAIEELGYTTPTPIQYQAIPEVLAGHDVLGVAQTGTGKTASFTLPLLEKLSNSRARARMPRSLILEPTRELALQVADNFELYGKNLRLNHALLIGGNSMNEQRDLLNRGVDVLIATPGRLLDLFDRGGLLLMQTDLLVIDEADRMLDMGFIPDIERIVSLLPSSRQTLFFSATMAPEIKRLADAFLTTPREITVARQSSVASTITERLCLVGKQDKKRALKKALEQKDVENAIIFCNRKRDVDELQAFLSRNRFSVGHLHGDLTQPLRFTTLEKFRSGELKILVCSDVAARGIDIDGLSHVFNYDLPFNAEDYVHRIGRTGRAGKEGFALSFALPNEHNLLEAIERLTGKVIEYIALEGIAPAQWSDEGTPTAGPKQGYLEKDPGKKKRDKNQNRQQKNSDSSREVHQAKKTENRSPDKKLDRSHNHKSFLPPIPDSDDDQQGFGDITPSFMNVSFKLAPHLFSDSK